MVFIRNLGGTPILEYSHLIYQTFTGTIRYTQYDVLKPEIMPSLITIIVGSTT